MLVSLDISLLIKIVIGLCLFLHFSVNSDDVGAIGGGGRDVSFFVWTCVFEFRRTRFFPLKTQIRCMFRFFDFLQKSPMAVVFF